jgi:hypothetical protein
VLPMTRQCRLYLRLVDNEDARLISEVFTVFDAGTGHGCEDTKALQDVEGDPLKYMHERPLSSTPSMGTRFGRLRCTDGQVGFWIWPSAEHMADGYAPPMGAHIPVFCHNICHF